MLSTRLGKLITVAPFTGAWIETDQELGIVAPREVAPFTGAWIETATRDSV